MPVPWSYSSYAGGEGAVWGRTVSKKAVKAG